MKGRSVLTIEHDWRIRKLIRANLKPLGLEVLEAVSWEHGLRLLDASQPDLVVLDLDLSDAEGMESLHLVETILAYADDHQMAVIFLAGEPPSRLWRLSEQAVGYVQKPFAAEFLLQQVRTVLDGDMS